MCDIGLFLEVSPDTVDIVLFVLILANDLS